MDERHHLLAPHSEEEGVFPRCRGGKSTSKSISKSLLPWVKGKSREKTKSESPKVPSKQEQVVEAEPEISVEKRKGGKRKKKSRSQAVPPDMQGLSPPKDDDILPKRSKESEQQKHDGKVNEKVKDGHSSHSSLEAAVFDRTQWERTRFAYEAAINSKKSYEAVEVKGEPTPMMGEARQTMAVRGDYLNARPKFTLILLSIEAVWCATCILIYAGSENPMLPLLLAILNMLVVFLLILGCLSVEFFRLQVRREDNRSETRFFVPYWWRYMICEAHILRACLLCANITIMAFDDDYDFASIFILAAAPIHLILVLIHIFIAIKPKRE